MFQTVLRFICDCFAPTPVFCEWMGIRYRIPMAGRTPEQVRRDFYAYVPKALVCVSCNRLFFPGMPVSLITPGTVISSDNPEPVIISKAGFAHCNSFCSPCINFCGWATENGKVEYSMEEIQTFCS